MSAKAHNTYTDYNSPRQSPTYTFTKGHIQIEDRKYSPVVVIEAALRWLDYSYTEQWLLVDTGGLEIAKDIQVNDWITQLCKWSKGKHCDS